MGYFTNYGYKLEIGVSQAAAVWTYATLAAGIDNLSLALNEVNQSYQFLSELGFAVNHTTGAAPVLSVSGKRVIGDTAQDHIDGLKFALDTARKSSLKLSTLNSTGTYDEVFSVPINIQNIVALGGGASIDDAIFSCDLAFDGKPTAPPAEG